MLVYKQIPKNKYDDIYKYYGTDFSGQSFLQNPEILFDNAYKYSPKEIVQYLALASFRRYSEYLATQKTTLSLLESPLGIDKIKQNRLLDIDIFNEIHFLYENSFDEEIKQWQSHLTK
jgi:uncharacterized protein (DUF924 family)